MIYKNYKKKIMNFKNQQLNIKSKSMINKVKQIIILNKFNKSILNLISQN